MDNCCVCTSSTTNLVKIDEITTKNHISIKHQLETLVPEVTWSEQFMICCKCQDNLNLIQEFRQQCLESQKLRQMDIKLEESTLTDYYPDPLSVDTDKLFLDESRPLNVLNDRPFICIYCGKGFKSKGDLMVHEKIHLNLREYECKLCQTRYNTYKNLYTHNKVKHTDPMKWRFQCSICGKRFPLKSNYDSHMKRHSKIRDIFCHLCNKAFNDKYVLKGHLETHTNSRQFKCDLCGVEYRFKRSLDSHKIKVHHIDGIVVPERQKNFVCNTCGKKFPARQKLEIHQRTHNKDKPFINCTFCDEKFSNSSQVEDHIRQVHNNKIIKKEET